VPASLEQLRAFIEKYPPAVPEATKAPLGPDAGSYTTEKLAEWLEACNVKFDEGRVGPGENGRGFWIECPGNTEGWSDGERHSDIMHSLTSATAVWVANGHPRFECRHAHCGPGARGGKKTWKNLVEAYDPGGAQQRRILTGAVLFGAQNPPIQEVSLQEIAEIQEQEAPKYPDVWGGTDYAEFADLCQKGNKIPREFFIESIKTTMGAIMGSNVVIQGEHGYVTGALPRFYTVLLAEGQGGKGTAIDWTLKLFEHMNNAGELIQISPLWWGSVDFSKVRWRETGCGACHATFNSVPGLGKLSNQPRILQTYGELSTLINNTGMDASGEGLLAVLRDLYDSPRYHVGATARRAPLTGNIQHSLLSGTTPELWGSMFAKKQVEGSGLFQRFNIIPAERVQRCSLFEPRLDSLRNRLLERIEKLSKEPVTIHIPTSSIRRLDEWFNPIANDPSNAADDYGRLNILALRNALHLAFTRDTREIGAREIDDAIALSDYQLAVRLRYKPASGYNDYALVEDELRRLVRATKKIKMRDVKRKLRKYGSRAVDFAAANLRDELKTVESTPENGGPKTVWLVWNS
jgi:hypothetical protein